MSPESLSVVIHTSDARVRNQTEMTNEQHIGCKELGLTDNVRFCIRFRVGFRFGVQGFRTKDLGLKVLGSGFKLGILGYMLRKGFAVQGSLAPQPITGLYF